MKSAIRQFCISFHRVDMNLICRMILISFLSVFLLNIARAQAAPSTPTISNKPPQQQADDLKQELSQAKAEFDQLSSAITRLKDEQNALAQDQRRTVEDTWKTLSFSASLSSVPMQILAIILAIGGLFVTMVNFGLYVWLQQRLEQELQARVTECMALEKTELKTYNKAEEIKLQSRIAAHIQNIKTLIGVSRFKVQASSLNRISHAFWLQSGPANIDDKTDQNDAITESEKDRNLNTAIWLALIAVQSVRRLSNIIDSNEKWIIGLKEEAELKSVDSPDALFIERDEFIEYEELIANVKSNAAYFLAERGTGNDPNDALNLAKEVDSILSKYKREVITNDYWREILESCCWVFWNHGDDLDKARIKHLIDELCNNDEIEPSWRSHISKKYFHKDLNI